MRFKVIATDLDGTIMNHIVEVPPRTAEALRRASEAGAWIVPVTARPPRLVLPVMERLGIGDYAIAGSGSLLISLEDGSIVARKPIPGDTAKRFVQALREIAPGIVFAAEQDLVFNREPDYPTIVPPELFNEDDAMNFLERETTKLIVKHPTLTLEELIDAVKKVVGDEAGSGIPGAAAVEILANGAGKAAMLQELCQSLGVAAKQVAAFGDWTIDAPMLAWAGLGVAPSDGHPDAVAAADELCAPAAECGVADVLERLLAAGEIGPADPENAG